MAWIERRGEKFRIKFRYGGRNFQVPLGTDDQREAGRDLVRFEENLRLLVRGRLALSEGADVGRFLLSDGRLDKKPVVRASLTLCALFERYESEFTAGAKEEKTRETERPSWPDTIARPLSNRLSQGDLATRSES